MNSIKLFDPVISSKEEKAILKVLKSKFWASGSGTGKVKQFETEFKHYTNSKSCVSVNSGTGALHLALSLFDLSNKEVIIPSLSFVSTAHAVVYNGAKPIFAEIDPKTLCIDPDDISRLITNKTKAILPVHFAGIPSNLKKIKNICKENNLYLIEDAAHASGSKYGGKKIGSHGDAVCFSFHPVKNLAMPTGGAITLNKNSQKFETLLHSRRWCGISNRKGINYDVNELGWNYYMNEFSAAMGVEQLKKLDKLNSMRKKIAKRFSQELKVTQKMPFDKNSSYHFFWILVKKRDKFMENMAKNNIETGVHYNPIHKMKFYNTKKNLPITEKITKQIVSIPCHPNLQNNDIDRIIKFTNKFC